MSHPIRFTTSQERTTYAAGLALIESKIQAGRQQRALAGIDTSAIVADAAREAVAKLKRLRAKQAAAKQAVRVSLARKVAPDPVATPSRGTMHKFCCGPIFG